jgi:hypothetical protein
MPRMTLIIKSTITPSQTTAKAMVGGSVLTV